ncbi:MAG TPA: hypothetical protein VGM44_14570 [Polyangiaceae bacterium]|jgi:hypothetical protein
MQKTLILVGIFGVTWCGGVARAEEPMPTKQVGGHVGVALPLVTVSSKTTTIADNVTILDPIGVGVRMSPHWVIDFETVVSNPVKPSGGSTGLIVDPGLIYDWGGLATGLRAAVQINAPANVGLIPLVNKGLIDLGRATWFVEAAFPTFYSERKLAFNVVLHTGVGF